MLPDLSDIDPRHLKIRLADAGNAQGIRIFCPCGHIGQLEIVPLIKRYGPEITFSHVERMARCEKCGGKHGLDARPIYTARIGSAGYST